MKYMKTFNKYLATVGAFLMMLIITPVMIAYGASATVEFTSGTDVANVGKDVSIVFTITSEDALIGDVETFISYDPDILQFVSGGDFIKGDNGILKVSDIDNTEGVEVKTYNLEFKAISTGVTNIEISGGNAEITDFNDMTSMSVSYGSLQLAVAASEEASDDCTLQSLKLSPGELDKEFDPEVTEYRITLPYENDYIVMSAIPNDPNARVDIKGVDDLVVGWNHPVITVTAQSGKTKEYSFSVYRESENEQSTPDGDSNPLNELVSSDNFKVLEKNGSYVIQSEYAYEVIDLEDASVIPTGYVKNSFKIYDNVTIPVYTLANEQNSDYLLIYASDATGNAQFYEFDKVEKTLQRYNGSLRDTVQKDAVEMTGDEYGKNLTTLAIIIAILASFVAILLVFSIKLFIKLRGYRTDELD